jgi:hypothetical protein
LGGSAPPAALIHAPLSLLPVAFPASMFQQVSYIVAVTAHSFGSWTPQQPSNIREWY